MIPLPQFHRDYLTMQGVSLLPKSRVISKPVQDREKEYVPVVPEYARGDM